VAAYLPGYSMVQLVRPPLLGSAWASDVGFYAAIALAYTAAAALAAVILFRWAPRD
jgi:hypothetical protein